MRDSDEDDRRAAPLDTIPVEPSGMATIQVDPASPVETPRPIDTERGPAHQIWSGSHDSGSFGRFAILDIIGAGGMGVVLAAHDPDLDRKVAIKVLRTRGVTGDRQKREAARLLREARTIAQLSHPHVVTVFEAGTIEDRVFIAMEYIEGQTLRAWLVERTRSVAEILDVFVKAGHGLAAGHAAGVVHRDFKPDNVLIGSDGRVRVIDFGLARPSRGAVDSLDEAPSSSLRIDPNPAGDRHTTAAFGTPVYMAPEQHLREEVDARADQFAFAVALYEALYQRIPFAGTTYGELVVNVTGGQLRAADPDRGVPAHVHAAIVRGLSTSPAARFPSMEAMLAELQPRAVPPAVVKRSQTLALVGIALAAAAAVVITLAVVNARTPEEAAVRCDTGAGRFVGVWDADTKARVRSSFVATDRSHAAATFDRVAGVFDQFVQSWGVQHREVCEATYVRRDRGPTAFETGMRCLDDDLDRLRGLTRMLSGSPDKELVDHAAAAANVLPDPSACAKMEARTAGGPIAGQATGSATTDAAVIARELGELETLHALGKYEAEAAKEKLLLERARRVGPEAEARVTFLLGKALSSAGKPAESEAAMREAVRLAALAKSDELAARAWIELIKLVGFSQARYADAIALEPVAEAAIQRADGDDGMRGDLAYAIGAAHIQKGDYERAADAFRRSIKLRTQRLGPEHPDVAQAHNSLGGALLRKGDLEGAKLELTRALAIREHALGKTHPDLALPLANLGALAQMQGDLVEATKYTERALGLLEEIRGPEHVDVGLTLNNLAGLEQATKDCASATRDFTRALGIFEKLGKDHPYVAFALVGRAGCGVDTGDLPAAIADAERGVAILAAKSGDPTQLAEARFVLARALWEANKDRARAKDLAVEAKKAYVEAGAAGQAPAAEVETWLERKKRE